MYAKHDVTAPKVHLSTNKAVPRMLAYGRLRKYDTIGDGDCAYHAFRAAILDKKNSGFKIHAPPNELTVPAMRQIVQANATEYCHHQVGCDKANHLLI